MIEELGVRYPTSSGVVTAVDRVSLDLHSPSSSLALVGETGCGKTSLALALLGLLPAHAEVSGRVLYEGRNLLDLSEREWSHLRGDRISAVPQNPSLALNPVYTIGRQIGEVFRIHRGDRCDEANQKAAALLERMKLGDIKSRLAMYPHQFSEGMNQRVLIAAAVALKPHILVADEPTKGLDADLKSHVIEELRIAGAESETSLFLITHDLDTAGILCGRIAVMYAGEIVEQAEAQAFFAEPKHPYAQALLDSLPGSGFLAIPGSPPSLTAPSQGCRFCPRCPNRMEICTEVRPEISLFSGREVRCHLYR
jgi:peptide/nickel transport system ATP-binding protein